MDASLDGEDTVVFLFFAPDLAVEGPLEDLKRTFPRASLLGCTGSGEIAGQSLLDHAAVATVARFERSTVRQATVTVTDPKDSFDSGVRLARKLRASGLKAVFLLSEGLNVNGTELARGVHAELGSKVIVSGGLAGDGTRFGRTVLVDHAGPRSDIVTAIGICGDDLKTGVSAEGGWLPFGPRRRISKATGNVLYELDAKPALQLYQEFLGPAAAGGVTSHIERYRFLHEFSRWVRQRRGFLAVFEPALS